MPETSKPKLKLYQWSTENLERAAIAVKTGASKTVATAARQFGIPKTTLYRHLTGTVNSGQRGPTQSMFTPAQENELEDYIVKCCELMFGLTAKRIKLLAYKYAERNNIKHNFNHKLNMASKNWLYGFLKHHPRLI